MDRKGRGIKLDEIDRIWVGGSNWGKILDGRGNQSGKKSNG